MIQPQPKSRLLIADMFNMMMLPPAGYKRKPGRFVNYKSFQREMLENLHSAIKRLPPLP